MENETYLELGSDFLDFMREQDYELFGLLDERCVSSNANTDYGDRENYRNVKLQRILLYSSSYIDLYYSYGRSSEEGVNISVANLSDAWDRGLIARVKGLTTIWNRDRKLNQILK